MDLTEVLKGTLGGVINLAVASIVGDLSKVFIPKNLKPMAKIGLALGGMLMTNAVTAKLSETVENIVDEPVTEEEP